MRRGDTYTHIIHHTTRHTNSKVVPLCDGPPLWVLLRFGAFQLSLFFNNRPAPHTTLIRACQKARPLGKHAIRQITKLASLVNFVEGHGPHGRPLRCCTTTILQRSSLLLDTAALWTFKNKSLRSHEFVSSISRSGPCHNEPRAQSWAPAHQATLVAPALDWGCRRTLLEVKQLRPCKSKP